MMCTLPYESNDCGESSRFLRSHLLLMDRTEKQANFRNSRHPSCKDITRRQSAAIHMCRANMPAVIEAPKTPAAPRGMRRVANQSPTPAERAARRPPLTRKSASSLANRHNALAGPNRNGPEHDMVNGGTIRGNVWILLLSTTAIACGQSATYSAPVGSC